MRVHHWCQPDLGQIADPFQIAQHEGIAAIALVGILFHAIDDSGMG